MRKHGVPFELARTVFNDPLLLTAADLEHNEAEERWFSVGRARNGAMLSVAYLWTDRLHRSGLCDLIGLRHFLSVKNRILSFWGFGLAEESNHSNVVHQSFHASVENVAGRDIIQNNVTSIQLLHVLETTVERSNTIPELQKAGLLQRLRSLMEEPYISGLATSAIFEGLKAVLTQGQ